MSDLRVPNRLKEYRLAQRPRPWTQERLIHELQRVGAHLGVDVASRTSLKVQVSRWENGENIGEKYRALFRFIYKATDMELGFCDTSTRETLVPQLAPVAFLGNWTEAFDQAAKEWKSDMERRGFLRGSAYGAAASTTPALQWLLGAPEAVAQDGGSFLVGAPHVETIREMTRTFRRLDNRFGGGHARETLMRFLTDEIVPLVRNGRYDQATGASLMGASAECLQLAGWMSYDAGLQGLGQRYMTQALRLAMACDDQGLGGEILAGLSHQASYMEDGATAVDLARAAGQTARQRGMDALVAEAAVMEAHGYAKTGNEAACARALSAAETALDKADRSADPAWIGYFDEAYLSAKFGHCFKDLRQPGTAERFARRSLDMDNSYVRGRAFNLALLATAHAQAGDVEEACAVGTQAVELVNGLQSVRANEYIRTLRTELAPHESASAVAAFDEVASGILAKAS